VKDVLRTICEQCPGTLHLKACSTPLQNTKLLKDKPGH
jgi:hypothetical protein